MRSGYLYGAFRVRVGQEQRELVAAESRDDVGLTSAPADHGPASISALLPARWPC